jgi:hypothetical protein
MENNSSTLKSNILQYGFLLGGISVVFALMLFFLDMHYTQESSVGIISIIITIAVIVLGQYNFRKDNNGFLSFGEALKLGVGIALISSIIGVTYQVLLVTVIDPDTIPKMITIAENQLYESYPEMSQEQIDQMLEMQNKFITPKMMAAFGLIGGVFIGFIISLITGLILKRNRPE